MPFLVVETIEKGAKKLSICPEGWVTDGNLKWPLKKSSKKRKIEDMVPRPNWLQMQCIIKRSNLNSYDAAEEELNKMVDMPETDQEGYANTTQSAVLSNNFNFIAEQLSSKQSTTASPAAEHSSGGAINPMENYIVVPSFDNNATNPTTEHAEEVVTYDSLLINQKILSENQVKIIDNQYKIMRTLATISVKIDKIASSHKEQPTPVTFVTELSNSTKTSPYNSKVTPIKNLDDLQLMENQLRDAETKPFFKNLYSVFCTPGKKGEICAFQLLFCREFLVQCSWSGTARGAGTKISIKLFQEVFGFFFELVHDCDPSYTVDKNNNFFKSIVKNAQKRTQSKLQRTSAPRKVPKRKLAPNSQNKTVPKSKQTEGLDNTSLKNLAAKEVIKKKVNNEDEAMAENGLIINVDINEEKDENLDQAPIKVPKRKLVSNLENKTVKKCKQTESPDNTTHENIVAIEVIKKKVNNEDEAIEENEQILNEETDAVLDGIIKNDDKNANLEGNNENEQKDTNSNNQLIENIQN